MSRVSYVKSVNETKKAYLSWEEDIPEEDKTWYEHRKMTEADYQRYGDLTSTVKLSDKKDKDSRAEVNMKLGSTRMFLLETLAVGWNAVDDMGNELPLIPNNLKKMPPEVIREWVDDIIEFNPVLKGDEEDEGNKLLTKSGEYPKA